MKCYQDLDIFNHINHNRIPDFDEFQEMCTFENQKTDLCINLIQYEKIKLADNINQLLDSVFDTPEDWHMPIVKRKNILNFRKYSI